MNINFQHPKLVHVVISGMRVEPQHAIKLLASGEVNIADIKYVYLKKDANFSFLDDKVFKSYAKAWQTQPNINGEHQYHKPDGFRIGAGAYGAMTVLTAGEIGKPR